MSIEALSEIDLLRKYLRYEPATGWLWWTEDAPTKVKGKQVTYKDRLGYVCLKVNGKMQKAHRVAWALIYGKFPSGHIDHINGISGDNRLCNLREVDSSVNMQNQRKARSDSSTGFLGVSKNGSGWRSEIRIQGKKKNLGTFKTPELAHAAYVEAKRKYHEGCTI